METVYAEMSCGQWVYWTYAEGRTSRLSRTAADKMIAQGARLVRC